MTSQNTDALTRAATGIAGLDEVLRGGLPQGEMHVIRGGPGTGKTTIGLQFLLEGSAKGEKVAFITLSQTERALRKIVASHGWALDGVDVREQSAMQPSGDGVEQTLFHTADVELGETMDALLAEVERLDPDRLVLDSIGQIRHLADTRLRYNRQLLALRDYFAKRSTTVLILDSSEEGEDALEDLTHGTIRLDRNVPEYGDVRRRIYIAKMRGMDFHGGIHNFRIRTGGLDVYPRLEPRADDGHGFGGDVVKSSAEELDALLGGGLEAGTACMLVGATGTGKTSVATLYAYAAAKRGQRAAIFSFDERPETFFKRSEGLGMDLRPLVEDGLIILRTVNTAELSPGECAQNLRDAVEQDDVKLVMIDSLTGYFHAMPQEEALLAQLHDLLAFLSERGVLTLLVVGQHGMLAEAVKAPLEVSYLADTVIVIRHFEATGACARRSRS